MTTIELVRHAEAVGRDEWWGKPDRDRPLTDLGYAQAKAIAVQLGEVDAVYSSPFRRCVQTVEPLAAGSSLQVVGVDGLAEARTMAPLDGDEGWVGSAWLGGRALALLDRVVLEHDDQRVVACSHGDVIPALMAVLVGRDGFEAGDVRLDKGAWFTLTFDGARCVAVARTPAPET